MKKQKKAVPVKTDPLFDVENVASFTECTGISPIGLEDGWQQNQLAALYAIHKRRADNGDGVSDDEDFPK